MALQEMQSSVTHKIDNSAKELQIFLDWCLERNPSHQCPEMEEHSDAKPLNMEYMAYAA